MLDYLFDIIDSYKEQILICEMIHAKDLFEFGQNQFGINLALHKLIVQKLVNDKFIFKDGYVITANYGNNLNSRVLQ